MPSERRTLSLTPGRPRTDKLVTVSAAAASVVDLSRLRQEVEKVWRGEESRVLEMSRAVQAAQQAVTNNEPGKRSSSTSDPGQPNCFGRQWHESTLTSSRERPQRSALTSSSDN